MKTLYPSSGNPFSCELRPVLAAVLTALSSSTLAQTGPNGPGSDQSPGNTELNEIVVTASRRSETVQDIPYNISAVGADELQKSGVTSINSLAQVVPGLQNIDTGPNTGGGNSNFIIRGLRTGAAGIGGGAANERRGSVSSVSTYLGETPIFFPVALDDLDRIEVLRGPQGTLYGSGAEGGTIRLIPKRPELSQFGGSVNVEGSGTAHATNANYKVDGVLNIPLGQTLALRVAAGEDHLAGFIDAVDLIQRQAPGNSLSPPVPRVPGDSLSGYALAPIERGVNKSDQWYVRTALRWQISDAVDAEISHLHQRVHVDDAQVVNPTYRGGTFNFGVGGALGNIDDVVNDPNATNTYRPGGKYASTTDALSPSTNELDLSDLSITADLGFATITSSTSAYRMRADESVSYTGSEISANGANGLASAVVFYEGFPRFSYYYAIKSRDEALTQEVRLVSNTKGPFSYVLGGYFQAQNYNNDSFVYVPGITGYVPSANPDRGDLVYYAPFDDNGFRFRDRALFGELTYKITPRWQVTGGARFFWQKFQSLGKAYFPWGGAPYSLTFADPTGLSIDVDNTSRVSDHIAKLNTSFDVTADVKLYATYSEGFRRGGANAISPVGPYASLPQYETFQPDKAKNYEIGVKGTAFDRRLHFSADVFLIDLVNFQFDDVSPAGYILVHNGTTARSKGFEVETDLRLTRSLLLQASYSYTDAKVRKSFVLQDYAIGGALDPNNPQIVPASSFNGGAKLPGVPAHTVNLGADYTLRVGDKALINLHGDAAYRSSSPSTIDPTSQYYWTIPDSFIANARLTYDSGQTWSADLFVNNLTNETAYTGGVGVQAIPSPFAGRYVTRPRTVGVGLHYRF